MLDRRSHKKKGGIVRGVGSFFVGTWRTLSGAELAAAKRDLQAARARQAALEQEREKLKDQAATLNEELQRMTEDLELCEERIRTAERRVAELRRQLEEVGSTSTSSTTSSSTDRGGDDGDEDGDGEKAPTQAELTRAIDEAMARIRLEQEQARALHQQIQETMRQIRCVLSTVHDAGFSRERLLSDMRSIDTDLTMAD